MANNVRCGPATRGATCYIPGVKHSCGVGMYIQHNMASCLCRTFDFFLVASTEKHIWREPCDAIASCVDEGAAHTNVWCLSLIALAATTPLGEGLRERSWHHEASFEGRDETSTCKYICSPGWARGWMRTGDLESWSCAASVCNPLRLSSLNRRLPGIPRPCRPG